MRKTLIYALGTLLGLLAAGLFMTGLGEGSKGTGLVIAAVVVLAVAAALFAWAAATRRKGA